MNGGHQLDYFEVPQEFLAIPDIANIDKEPSQNYEFPTKGKLHGRKLKQILEWLKTPEIDGWKDLVNDVFVTDIILEDLLALSFSQFLDFVLHLTYANPSVNWNSISILEKYIQDQFGHVSRWNLPSFEFDVDMRGLLTKRYRYSFQPDVVNDLGELKKLIENIDHHDDIFPEEEWDKIRDGLFTNIDNMLELLGNLRVVQTMGLVKYEKYNDLIMRIVEKFQSEISELFRTHPEGKILFTVFLIEITIRDDPAVIELSKNLLNIGTVELIKLERVKKESFQWLTDAARVLITNEILKYRMEMVTEDILMRSISERFLFPENTDLQHWMQMIETTDLPIEIAMIMIRGYLSVEELLYRYSTQLPNSDNTIMISINNFLVSLLTTFELRYVEGKTRLSYGNEYWFIKAWADVTMMTAIITPPAQYLDDTKLIERIENSKLSTFFNFEKVCFEMITGKYPFQQQLGEIFKPDDEYPELIGNEVFAKYFIDTFATRFNYAQQCQTNGIKPPIDVYQYMIYYQMKWMTNLVNYMEYLVEDILMIFVSFLRVATNMIQFYYNDKGRIKTGELWELNYILLELNLSARYGYPQIYNIQKKVHREHMFDDFLRLIGEFGMAETINVVDTKHFAMDTVFDVASFQMEMGDVSVRPEKLQDENILEYMDLRNALEDFLLNLEVINTEDLPHVFGEQKFPPRTPPGTILDHIKPEELLPGIFYPFIQPLEAFASAIRFFDLVVELPAFKEGTEV